LVGVFERGSNLQNRLEEIMNYEPTKSRFGWLSVMALIVFGIVFVPTSPAFFSDRLADAEETAKPAVNAPAPKAEYPTIVETTPKIGTTDVDPGVKEIRVKFDRDMKEGMSWTGGPPDFPPTDKARKPKWTDRRTCILPVKLEAGKYYRTGINSSSHKNFQSAEGIPTPSSAIFFTTKGGDKDLVRVPKITKLEPSEGATDVDPNTQELEVTFDIPMSSGMSWCCGDGNFPKTPENQQASWSADELTCKLPVKLEPGRDYLLCLNDLNHINFQSKSGVPLAPVVFKFRTRAAKE
jgi:RNA polymerase sigma-70 factor (ECF subfamily)